MCLDVDILLSDDGRTFATVVRDRGDDKFAVGFRRIKDDNCKALVPDGRRMSWSFAELGIPRNSRVYLMNRVGR